MTLEQMDRVNRTLAYWAFAILTALACWYYSKEMERFDGLSLLLAFHAAWTLRHWFEGVYGKMRPAELYEEPVLWAIDSEGMSTRLVMGKDGIYRMSDPSDEGTDEVADRR